MPALAGTGASFPVDPRVTAPILSPCIGVCSLDDSGLCEGCLRTSSEIARWSQLGDAERQYVMDVVLPRREAQRG